MAENDDTSPVLVAELNPRNRTAVYRPAEDREQDGEAAA